MMTNLDKLAALEALGKVKVYYPNPSENKLICYVSGLEIKRSIFLTGASGWGTTKEAAIDAYWERVTTALEEEEYLVVNAYRDDRQAVKWNGFMWKKVVE